jgi:hypothetical protein
VRICEDGSCWAWAYCPWYQHFHAWSPDERGLWMDAIPLPYLERLVQDRLPGL